LPVNRHPVRQAGKELPLPRKKVLVATAALATVLGLYALAGFYWVPRLVTDRVTMLIERDFNRKASLGEVRFNPFTFEFEARDFSLPDADGRRMLGFGRFYFNFELSSLWRRAWTFSDIAIEHPYARVVQRADGKLNFMDLVPANDAQPAADKAPTDLPPVRIADLDFSEGEVDVEDLTLEKPFDTRLMPVTFELTDFQTQGTGNHFAFTAGSDDAGTLQVEGSFGVEPLSSRGSLKLAGLPATKVSEYLGDFVPVTMQSGVIDLGFDYDFSLAGDPFTFILDMPSLQVRDLSTLARGYEIPWQIPAVEVRDTHVDLSARSVRVGSVEVRDIVAPAWLDAAGFHAPGLLPPQDAAGPAGASATAPGGRQREWSVSVPSISLVNARLPLEDRSLATPASLEVTARSVKVAGFAMPQREPLQVEAEIVSGAGGEITAKGTVQLEPLQAGLDVKVSGLDLKPVQAYLDGGTDLLLESGALHGDGRVELATVEPLAMSFTGAIGITDLHTRDRPLKEDFINWKSLDVKGIRYSSAPASLSIREIIAQKPYIRLILAASGITNIETILDPKGAAEKAAAIAAQRAAGPNGKASKPDAKTAAAATDLKTARTEPAMAVAIGVTRIIDGNINFADYTIEPNFRIAMEGLDGSIKGSSSDPDAHSELELDGEVDRYAPVHLAGQLNLLAPTAFIDITGYFRNIDLTSFNPYSTKFVGYQIAKGKLSIETQYKVTDRQLQAVHKITVDQLEFGQRIDSPDAIGLPVKLAVALLKDSQGVIDLELPINGSIDDPQFRLGPIIWKAFVGLLTKVVTAPFALLGSLFGNGADLSYIDFAPGSIAIDAAATEKIASLRKALTERPGLKLDIPWTAAAPVDAPALDQARWEAAVNGAGGQAPNAAWKTDRQEYLRRLKLLYEQANGTKPDLPKPPKPAEGEPKVDPVEFAIGQLEPGLKAGMKVGADDIEALAQARAEAVRNDLLGEDGLNAERVFINRGEDAKSEGGAVRMTLTLK
jgi:hypothetical protein